MTLFKLTMLTVAMLVGIAFADDDAARTTQFKMIVDSDGSGSDSTMVWSSDQMDFYLDDLASGETRTFTGESGEAVTISRNDSGYTFNVAGESIDIPNLDLDRDSHGAVMKYVSIDGMDHDFDVEVIEDSISMLAMPADEGIVIISPEPLDSSVKESIKSVLISAGKDDEVTFIDGSHHERHVMVVKKDIETN